MSEKHSAKTRRQPSYFAVDKEGQLFVKTRAVMSTLVSMIDGLPIITFGRNKTWYLPVDVAIDWCRKEAQHHSQDKYTTMIDVMERAKKQLADEQGQDDKIDKT